MNEMSKHHTDDEIESVVKNYSNTLYKLCFSVLFCSTDAEDAVAETIVKYITKSPPFKDEQHRKAWLLRVAANTCNDICRKRKRVSFVPLDDVSDTVQDDGTEIFEALSALPPKYRAVVHLFYVSGYKTAEIAEILKISQSAVRKRLQYGREKLRSAEK